MKNPMIENNINAELFEAIDENAINGGLKLTLRHSLVCFITPPITVWPESLCAGNKNSLIVGIGVTYTLKTNTNK
ncbi:MAG TPA: hypothetical protein P5092_08735 [Ruminococcus sp.]|nr:hypothetical protein [Ruminococcus sp.]